MLEVKDLHVEVGGKEILHDINLQIGEGETHVLMGPNGSGKSTLLMTIMGFSGYTVTQGSIRFKGKDVTGLPVNERARMGMGIMFQRPPTISGLKLAKLLTPASGESREEIEKYAKAVNMERFLDRDINKGISGGETKRSEVLPMSTPLEWGRDKLGFAGRVARTFLHSRLTPLTVVSSTLLGLLALATLPREEDPQIKVPVVDVQLAWPGAPAVQVERQLTTPVELHLWKVSDLEYLYSTSSEDGAVLNARFKVGLHPDKALARVRSRLDEPLVALPPDARVAMVAPRSIDDRVLRTTCRALRAPCA